MSIRTYNKDHLKDHAGLTLATPVRVDAPQSGDPLVFWTQNETEPCEVNLHRFATGQENNPSGGGRKFIPFTGRPELILQLAPAIEEALLYAAKKTVQTYLDAYRAWWRVLDAVEAAAAAAGQPMTRVEDVRLLTQMHSEFAHRSGMRRQAFCTFRALVDTTRMALGGRSTYWESPEDPDVQKHIPPQEQRDALRFALKRTCRDVLERLAQSERLSQCGTEPKDPPEANLWRQVQHMRNIQKKTGKLLPTSDELRDGFTTLQLNRRGIFIESVRESSYPSHWDADAVWHFCLVNTPWNPSTLTSLDVSRKFLIDHFKDCPSDSHRRFVLTPATYDPESYDLVGVKARAGGTEQIVTGQWKSLDGPGHLIKTYLERVAPLRELLKQQLDQEKLNYKQMEDAGYEARTEQYAKVTRLEQGVRSVWLYVNGYGSIDWISNDRGSGGTVNGKLTSFLDAVVHVLNTQRNAQRAMTNARLPAINARRAQRGKKEFALLAPLPPLPAVPHVTGKDFRVWFADYVYRKSFGNMLHVQRELNHRRLGTTVGYTDTTILNQESSDSARCFLNILIRELGAGRVDLTILAHLYQHGEVTPEQEILLAQARTLPKSRMKVACKDARHPPAHIKATRGEDCDVQRCLLCPKNAVLLPESLDGIAMRSEELRALQGFLPIETWIEEMYDMELKNNLMALRKFDLNQGLAARQKWAKAIAVGEHYVPGLPLASSLDLMELV